MRPASQRLERLPLNFRIKKNSRNDRTLPTRTPYFMREYSIVLLISLKFSEPLKRFPIENQTEINDRS
jgi:hypothetical protein